VGFSPTPTPLLGLTPHPVYEAYGAAVEAFKRGEHARALSLTEQVLSLDPDLPDVHYLRGEAYRLLERYEEAQQAYQQALEADAGFAPAYLGAARARLALEPEGFPPELDQALERDPGLSQAYRLKADLLARDQAWGDLTAALSTASRHGAMTPWLQYRLGQAQYHLGQIEGALQTTLEGALADQTLLEPYLLISQVLVRMGRLEEALNHARTYTAYRADDPHAWLTLAKIQFGLGNEAETLEAMDQVLLLRPEDADLYYLRGSYLLGFERAQEALADLLRARELGMAGGELGLAIAKAHVRLQASQAALDELRSVLARELEPELLAAAFRLRAGIFEDQNPPALEQALASWRALLDLQGITDAQRQEAQEAVARLESLLATATPSGAQVGTATPSP
jgi:tetratricopeptide (TPR) repeat protein